MAHALKFITVTTFLKILCCSDKMLLLMSPMLSSTSVSSSSQPGSSSGIAAVVGESSCETLPSTIHISKELNNEHGQLVRTCEGDLAVNKCEGTCQSQLQPSVVKPSGFLKECQCCRETNLRERDVILAQCYNPEGQQIIDGQLAQLNLRLKEPTACRCFKCGND